MANFGAGGFLVPKYHGKFFACPSQVAVAISVPCWFGLDSSEVSISRGVAWMTDPPMRKIGLRGSSRARCSSFD